MFGIKWKDCVKNIMIKNKLLTILQLYESEIAILMYRFQKHNRSNQLQLFQFKPCQIETKVTVKLFLRLLAQQFADN